MGEPQETINKRVCIKVLSCDSKGVHVTFKWKISKNKPTEIYLHLLYLTELTETFYTLTLHSFHFAMESHESSCCFYGEVLAVMHSLLTQLNVTQRLTSQKHTA